jgi:hypothetical protein
MIPPSSPSPRSPKHPREHLRQHSQRGEDDSPRPGDSHHCPLVPPTPPRSPTTHSSPPPLLRTCKHSLRPSAWDRQTHLPTARRGILLTPRTPPWHPLQAPAQSPHGTRVLRIQGGRVRTVSLYKEQTPFGQQSSPERRSREAEVGGLPRLEEVHLRRQRGRGPSPHPGDSPPRVPYQRRRGRRNLRRGSPSSSAPSWSWPPRT